MAAKHINKTNTLKGTITIPGDKSISHRAIMLGAISEGRTEITNFLQGADCLSTISCFQSMGISIENKKDIITIYGNGMHGLKPPKSTLNAGNSGTTMRLLSGILSGQRFSSQIDGDSSLQKRPMNRIILPLTKMGASIQSLYSNECCPLVIKNSSLHGISYPSPVASAQIKSAILLAGLYADGKTSVKEPYLSRNHTELMLRYFGAVIESKDTTAAIHPCEKLSGQKVEVPGDISSAAYFMAAAAMVKNSEVLIKNVGINPTRDGMIQVMKEMGANITLENQRYLSGEPAADLLITGSSLNGITIEGARIPTLIDELPIIAVLATQAQGKTIIKDAGELKVKESNRIDIMVHNLSLMGADVIATEDGMIINGGSSLIGAKIPSHFDHRIAMSFAVAALAAKNSTTILDSECVEISYPDFYTDLENLCQ